MPYQIWKRRWEKAGKPYKTEDGAIGAMAAVAIEEDCEVMVVPVEDGDPNDWEDEEEDDGEPSGEAEEGG